MCSLIADTLKDINPVESNIEVVSWPSVLVPARMSVH